MGRPTRYKQDYAERAYGLCLLGYTDKELGEAFDVSEQTINTWKHKHPKFLESIKSGKEKADLAVVQSLYKKATGYKVKKKKFAAHEGIITDEREYEEDVAPDQRSIEFWLRNRQGKKWRNDPESDNNDNGKGQQKAQIFLPQVEKDECGADEI